MMSISFATLMNKSAEAHPGGAGPMRKNVVCPLFFSLTPFFTLNSKGLTRICDATF